MSKRNTLSIDVGSSHVKAQVMGPRGAPRTDELKVDTPESLTPRTLTRVLTDVAAELEPFDRVSVGLPGIVHDGIVYSLPVLGERRMKRFEIVNVLERRLGRPVRAANDAEMHGLGVIRRRGVELVLTLGTGLGTALYLDGELGSRLQFLDSPDGDEPDGGAYGDDALDDLGTKRWSKRVHRLIETMRHLTNFDRCYVGGGNAKRIRGRLAKGVTRVDNSAARLGGVRLWEWDLEP